MAVHPLAGKPAPPELLIDVTRLEREYFARRPDPADPVQRVSFGTSGHRGSPLDGTFAEAHILAITQALCDYRQGRGIRGPLYLGRDTHGISPAAQRTALEVLAANAVETRIAGGDAPTPTPVISRAILAWRRSVPRACGLEWTRWEAPRWIAGRPSPSASGWTSRWSTGRSIPPSAS